MTRPPRLLALLVVATSATCSTDDASTRDANASASGPATPLTRDAWNARAAELALPLFWRADDDGDGAIDPGELAVLIAPDAPGLEAFVSGDAFTPAFDDAARLIAAPPAPPSGTDEERARQALLLDEIRQGRPSVVYSDWSAASAEDRAVVTHVLRAARLVEELHARQLGTAGMLAEIPRDDRVSRAVFVRNQGPWCAAPRTEANPACNALARRPARLSGLYPKGIQSDPGFCQMLEARPDQETLMSPFVVVEESATGDLVAVPYHEAYRDLMTEVARALDDAAASIEDPAEEAFKLYLRAAAESFRTNDWQPADEAWSRMSVDNSKWYLRIGPDEVYFEPCSRKAGFHVSFARINKDSVEWQQKLEPVKRDLERALAELAGPPYVARDVSFHLPDFIDIIVNAGDARSPHGATIGQSLPNWGPVANEGRGRTVAMTNLYTDEDSKAQLLGQAKSVMCADTFALVDADPRYGTMSTVLHEAAHNLGPAHEYRVDGKTDDAVFGGPLASTLEELKSQTAALFFSGWLAERKLVTPGEALKARVRDVLWACGHISRGMYSADGKPKPYSQLAAIQLGFLLREGALAWRADEKAANGVDLGCLAVDQARLDPAIGALARRVLEVKGRGDRAGAEARVAHFVDADDAWAKARATITERWLRTEKTSFVYAVKLTDPTKGATK